MNDDENKVIESEMIEGRKGSKQNMEQKERREGKQYIRYNPKPRKDAKKDENNMK